MLLLQQQLPSGQDHAGLFGVEVLFPVGLRSVAR